MRLDAEPDNLDALCQAYLRRAGEDEFFSHITAAKLWGIPLPDRYGGRRVLDVSVLSPSHPPQTAGIAGHRLRRATVTKVRGLPVVSPMDAWMQLASSITPDELVVAGDFLVRRKRPLATLAELKLGVLDASGHRGVRRLRQALHLVRAGTDSPAESRMRLLLVHAGLPEPVVRYPVFDGATYVGTPDLAFPQQRVCLEYEGDGHRTDRRTFRYDIERHEQFRDADWYPIRVTADHLRTPNALAQRVFRALARR